MMGNFENITVVLQGPVHALDDDPLRPSIGRVLESVRRHLPGAAIVLSTWAGAELPDLPGIEVVTSDDPGPLPTLKRHTPVPNNVNRQILSSSRGLAVVKSKYALKMRTDCLLTGNAFVVLQSAFPERTNDHKIFRERVVVANLYTINPRVFEELPFHPSDWFQFGLTEDVRRLWAVPFMTEADATYFARHRHRARTTELDGQFNARFAVEQHIFLNCLKSTLDVECDFLNDVRTTTLALHDRIFANNLVVVELDQAGFSFPKNDWASKSFFQSYNCYTHRDWLVIYRRHCGGRVQLPGRLSLLKRRCMMKFFAVAHANPLGRLCLKHGLLGRMAGLLLSVGFRSQRLRRLLKS